MGRPGKVKVDYFPHVTNTGKTIAILESRWGNDGYAFWFKLLELLGNTNGFCYNCNSSSDWEYLLSRTRVTEETAAAILDKLAEIEAIDDGLWREKKIWSDNFVSGVVPAFEKRKSEIPRKPGLLHRQQAGSAVDDPGNDPYGDSGEFPAPETGRGEEKNAEENNGEENDIEEIKTEENDGEVNAVSQPPCPSRQRAGVEAQADTVFLKPSEMERLSAEYGAEGAGRMVEILDAYKTNHPDKCAQYRDDYKVIVSWVISRYLEERGKAEMPVRGSPPPGRRAEACYAMARLEQMAEEAAADEQV